jgi:diguanylate cyclase (GGDEF)-like protein
MRHPRRNSKGSEPMNRETIQDNNFRVLIVDDDTTIRFLASETLEHAGISVLESDNGTQALALFEQAKPDIILLDVQMPGMDGFAVCSQIREHPEGQNIPIIMMTGHDDIESIKRAYEIGATDFISKPLNWLILCYRVRYMLRASRTFKNLNRSEARLSYAQRIARIGNWEWDIENDQMHWTDAVYDIFNIAPTGFGNTYQAFLNSIHPLDKELVNLTMGEALKKNKPYNIDHQIILSDGTERFVHTEAEIIADKDGRPVQLFGIVQDITERKESEDRIRNMAYFDSLTGLPNRILFKENLQHSLAHAERKMRKVATLFLDLDRFKQVNDTMGHSIGDKLLQECASRLTQCIRKYDHVIRNNPVQSFSSVARLGGDEFTIILDDIDQSQDAAKVAQRINEELAVPYTLEGQEVIVTASIGISIYPDDGRDISTLIKNADTAMYHAKDHGRNNFQFYSQSMTATAFEKMKLEYHLRRAIDREEFTLVYQPQVDISSGNIIGLEALIRWRNPELGQVSPATFIHLAEETGLISCIDEWVIFTACTQMMTWEEAGLTPVRVAVNLSGKHFFRDRLLESVHNIIATTGIRSQFLELELTESVFMQFSKETIATLNALKGMGISLSIDDFGTGYSSLAYLKRFPITTLKIDQSFVREVTTDTDSAAIVTAIIAMARSLQMKVIAEGVETEEQLNFLRDHDCCDMQGFLFSRPLSVESITQMLEKEIKFIFPDKFLKVPGKKEELAGDLTIPV